VVIPYLELKLLDKLKRGVSKTVRDTNFGKIILLDYKKKFFKGFDHDSIKLEVHLEGKYPFQQPKVILSTSTVFPSLADGRNLLSHIIKKAWSEECTVLEIANLFPGFLNENFNNPGTGRFHLGQCMYLRHWENREYMRLFAGQEIDPQNPKFCRDRAIVVTHSMVLQLETNPQYPGLAHLVCYASLSSLQTVKMSKSDPEKVTFEWRMPDSSTALAQQFKIKSVNAFIELLMKNTQRLGIGAERRVLRPTASISEEDVNAQALSRVKIGEINADIVQHEVDIQDEVTKEKVNELIDLYQRAIEYYSALNDAKYDMYLQKVRKLWADEVVLAVLAGKPAPKKVEIKPARDIKVIEFEEREIWPSGPPEKSSDFGGEGLIEDRKDEEMGEEEEKEEEGEGEEKEEGGHQEEIIEKKLENVDENKEENLEEAKADEKSEEKQEVVVEDKRENLEEARVEEKPEEKQEIVVEDNAEHIEAAKIDEKTEETQEEAKLVDKTESASIERKEV
jgi:hypothetical protein